MILFEYKKKGGKLIGVSFEYQKYRFSNVCIYGDFFIFPEENLQDLEKSLEGKSLAETFSIIEDFFSTNIKTYGIEKEDLMEIFKRAINEM